ncbi:MAG: hypothetical protein PHR87_13825 [Sulfurospirillaceae bacterium]|nr:hypothetical protein [Sulfurospirillaceae bacterium]
MKNNVKFLFAVGLLFLSLFLAINIVIFYNFGVASALDWHKTLGVVLFSLVPIHLILHFKKFKKLFHEFYQSITFKKSSMDTKKEIIKRLGAMKFSDYALWLGVSYERIYTMIEKEFKVTIHQEETLDELSKRINEEVFALYLKSVYDKLHSMN